VFDALEHAPKAVGFVEALDGLSVLCAKVDNILIIGQSADG
jgi:hypothetical protein